MRATTPTDDGREPPELPVSGGSGVQPGVELGDQASLRDLMDEGDSIENLR